MAHADAREARTFAAAALSVTVSREAVATGRGDDFSAVSLLTLLTFLTSRPESLLPTEADFARVLDGGVASAAEGALAFGDFLPLRPALEPPDLGVGSPLDTGLDPSNLRSVEDVFFVPPFSDLGVPFEAEASTAPPGEDGIL